MPYIVLFSYVFPKLKTLARLSFRPTRRFISWTICEKWVKRQKTKMFRDKGKKKTKLAQAQTDSAWQLRKW